MKKAANNQRKPSASGGNGKLDDASINAALDRILKAMDEVNRELDELIAKARG